MTKEDFDKILSVREKLVKTYKLSCSEDQKRRLSRDIKDLDITISDIKANRPVDPKKIASIIGAPISSQQKSSKQSDKNYADIIEVVEVIKSGKDYDFDLIYSFLTFFEKNLSSALSGSYLKLDFALSKKRDECFMSYDSNKRMIEQYIADCNAYSSMSADASSTKERLRADRRLILVKLNDNFISLRKLFDKLVEDLEDERNTILNKDEVFRDKYSIGDNYYDGKRFSQIVIEADKFFAELIDIIDLPKF